MRLSVASAALLISLTLPNLNASPSVDALAMDAAGLAQLENRAEHAAAREQCYLYTELVQVYTQIASHQLSAGDTDQANTTLKRVQHFAELVHQGLARDSKHLKDAEMAVHTASYHLGEFMHHVSGEDKAVAEATMKQLNKVHDELLAQVFAH